MYMAAAWLGYKRGMVGTVWATSLPGCINRLGKLYFQLVGGPFLAGKVILGSEQTVAKQKILLHAR